MRKRGILSEFTAQEQRAEKPCRDNARKKSYFSSAIWAGPANLAKNLIGHNRSRSPFLAAFKLLLPPTLRLGKLLRLVQRPFCCRFLRLRRFLSRQLLRRSLLSCRLLPNLIHSVGCSGWLRFGSRFYLDRRLCIGCWFRFLGNCMDRQKVF